MARFIGLDFGAKRVGVALSDDDKRQAFPRETITYDREKELIDKIHELCRQEEVERIILGLPYNLKGEKTEWTDHIENFANRLGKAVRIPIDFQDERLTSKMTLSLFREKGKKREKKSAIDALSARIILQDFLDKMNL